MCDEHVVLSYINNYDFPYIKASVKPHPVIPQTVFSTQLSKSHRSKKILLTNKLQKTDNLSNNWGNPATNGFLKRSNSKVRRSPLSHDNCKRLQLRRPWCGLYPGLHGVSCWCLKTQRSDSAKFHGEWTIGLNSFLWNGEKVLCGRPRLRGF